jgi:hypothetical protein
VVFFLYICRETSTNPFKNAKQTQFFEGRNLWKMFIYRGLQKKTPSGGVKNKPNSNPIQTQSKPILAQKSGGQSQFKPKQTQ